MGNKLARYHVGGHAEPAFVEHQIQIEGHVRLSYDVGDDGLPELRMRNAKSRALAHRAARVEYFFDFRRADSIARSLDHFVAPADEIEVALFIPPGRVPRKDGDLRQNEPRFAAIGQGWEWPETLARARRVIPIAEGDQGAALNQLSGFVGRAFGAILPEDEDLGVRDRPANGVGASIDFLGGEVGGAKGFGQTIHQIGPAFWELPPKGSQGIEWHSPAGVGEIAQVFIDAGGPCELGQLDPQGRHSGQSGYPFLGDCLEDVAGEQVIQQHDPGAGQECGSDLGEAGIEGQGQGGQEDVVAVVLQVLGHAPGTTDDIPVTEDDALGPSGAARGVQDGGHVQVDDPVSRTKRGGLKVGPGQDTGERRRGLRGERPGDDDVTEIMARRQGVLQGREALGGGHQNSDVAVAQDVADLIGLEEGIDRDENAACVAAGKGRDDRFRSFLEVDRDTLAAAQAHLDKGAGQGANAFRQAAIVQCAVARGESDRFRSALGGLQGQMMEQVRHGVGDSGGRAVTDRCDFASHSHSFEGACASERL